MMKKKNVFQNLALLSVLILGFGSCENDFAELGTNLVGVTNFSTDHTTFPVISYNKIIGPFQSNSLSDNLFGIYNDPVYGPYTANIVSQMTPTAYDPEFGENVVLDSVILTIPYFSFVTETDEDGNNTYQVDSIYGNSPIKLTVFQNNYFLRDFDPDSEFDDSQKYYSDRSTMQGSFIDQAQLEGQILYQDDEFFPDLEEIILTDIEVDEDGEPVLDDEGNPVTFESGTLAPSLRVHLDNPNDTYWQDLIFAKEGEPELSNENNFLNYFRGLYFKAEAISNDGNMSLLNLASTNASITLYYTSEMDETDPETDSEVTTEAGTFVMNFTNNTVTFYENNFNSVPEPGDPVNGNDRLYLKGSQGHMAVINLFNGDEDGESDILTDFRNENWLINEARLVFYVDQNIVNGEEPNRIYLYDLNNNIPLVDYFFDQTGGNLPEFAKTDHLQPLVREGDDPDGAGIKYEIEVTEHIKNIIDNDSTNVKLGLIVTSNAIAVANVDLQDEDGCPEIISSGSAVSPRGTVLHGNTSSDIDKRLKLDVFYTEPNDN